jgi:predicted transcriptional regulator
MIIGNENIITWFKAQKRPNWRLKKSANSDVIAFSQTTEPSDDEGLQELKDTFEYIAPGQYFLECWKSSDRKSWVKDTVQIEGTAGKNFKSGIAGIYGPEDVQAQVQKGIEEYKRNEETEQMKKRLEELEAEQASLQNQILKRLTPYLDTIGALAVKYLSGNAPVIGNTEIEKKKVTKTPNNEIKMEDQELIQQASEALTKWYEADNDAVILMQKIAELAIKDPSSYETAKNLLMKM